MYLPLIRKLYTLQNVVWPPVYNFEFWRTKLDKYPLCCFYSIVMRVQATTVTILPTRGDKRGFRQKTIHDRRELDKLMEFGSREIDFGRVLHLGN